MITGHGDIDTAVAAMKEGALDFIQKPFSKGELLAALEVAWEHLRSTLARKEDREGAIERIGRLTPRERQVVEALVKGHANKVIAFDLGLSPRTVELYRANAARKLGARSFSEMLQIAFMAGITAG